MLVAVQDPAWLARNLSPEHVGTAAQNAVLAERAHAHARLPSFGARRHALRPGFRQWREHRVGSIRLTYPDRTIRVARGFSVLEASLINNIPHAHVCGGRGRCSTCRIRVLGDVDGPPGPERRRASGARARACGPGGQARLPASSDQRHHASCPCSPPTRRRVDAYRTGAAVFGRRALSRHHVCRHARIEPAGREAPAVRHRVHHQPVSQRREQRGVERRRRAQPGAGRRAVGPVRHERPARRRLPAGDRRQRRNRRPGRERSTARWLMRWSSRSASASASTPA